jgi:hypothetical protein
MPLLKPKHVVALLPKERLVSGQTYEKIKLPK